MTVGTILRRTLWMGGLAMALGLAVTACKPAEPAQAAPPAATTQATPPAGGSGSGIAPLGPNVGGITPVAGGENLGGGSGGGVGNAAKDRARQIAAGGGAPAGAGQMVNEGGE
ncbi:MAG: hypothetical protein IT203_12810 [Fimbriimonadaceae bacterium]|nr:hypothetical protein [Fimbriimonadaceae bacterium]